MRVKLDEGAYLPIRAHKTDAGLDIRSRETKVIHALGHATFRTGVHVELPKGTAAIMVSKSGLNVNHHITSTGLIDEGYTGEIVVKLYNHGTHDYKVNEGDKISQLVIVPVLYEEVERVYEIELDTERGNSGFGSSGR